MKEAFLEIIKRLQWENVDDIFLFFMIGIMVAVLAHFGMKKEASMLAGTFGGAITMYLKGGRDKK